MKKAYKRLQLRHISPGRRFQVFGEQFVVLNRTVDGILSIQSECLDLLLLSNALNAYKESLLHSRAVDNNKALLSFLILLTPEQDKRYRELVSTKWWLITPVVTFSPDRLVLAEPNNNLAGDYILLATYAAPDDSENDTQEDEYPISYIAVKRQYLESYISEDGQSPTLEEFLDTYIYDDIMDLEAAAERDGALAFVYRPDAARPFRLPEICEKAAISALMDFISGNLRENGFKEAAEYFDSFFGA